MQKLGVGTLISCSSFNKNSNQFVTFLSQKLGLGIFHRCYQAFYENSNQFVAFLAHGTLRFQIIYLD